MIGKLLLPEIEEAIKKKQFVQVKEMLREFPPPDLADLFLDMDEELRSVLFRILSTDQAADLFEMLPPPEQEELITSLSKERLTHILEEMEPDDRTSLLEELPAKVAHRLLSLLPHEERRIAQMLLNYPEDSVGRLMTTDFISFKSHLTVAESLEKIRTVGHEIENIDYCYVIEENFQLTGIVSLRNLVLASPDEKLEDLMLKEVVSLPATEDQEEAAKLCAKYDLLALPVVDSHEKLIGVVTVDDLMDVAEDEATEDIQRMAAVIPTEASYLYSGFGSLLWRRAIWLIALLVIEIIASIILKNNEATLQAAIVLAFFLPVLSATGGNTGTQSAMMVIRSLATGELHLNDFFRVLGRALLMGISLGLILGLMVFPVVLLTQSGTPATHQFNVALTIAIALATVIILSNLTGALLPLVLKSVGLDPALVSGPFISTLVDVGCLLIYFEIARHLLFR